MGRVSGSRVAQFVKLQSRLLPVMLVAAMAVAARFWPGQESKERADWEKDRVYRPPIVRRFNPAPGYTAVFREWRQYRDPNQLEIYQGGECVYRLESEGRSLAIGEQDWGFQPIARDVNGNDIPDLIVREDLWASAKCHIFELGTRFRQIVELDEAYPHFHRDPDNRLVADFRDQTFSCWRCCHADSSYPAVTLRLLEERFVLAPELMWRKPPIRLQENLARLRQLNEPALTRQMTQMLYTGHPELAIQALRATSLSHHGQNEFLRDFKARLRTSPWAAGLADQLPDRV